MGKNRNKLHYVRGVCELEKGDVYFEGGMSGVSSLQVWYYVIYAIKDKFKEIDFWIDPKMERCETLPSTSNYLRYGKCQKFICEYKPFPEGVVKPKRKLSALDKKKYAENRAKVDLGVKVELREPTFDLVEGDIVFDEPVRDEGGNEVNYIPTEPTDFVAVERVPYKVRSEVCYCNGEVHFKSSNEDYTYSELDTKLKLYRECKEIMLNCCKGYEELGDKVLKRELSNMDINIASNILLGGFKTYLDKAKDELREIDLYVLCKEVGKEGLVNLQSMVNNADESAKDGYIEQYGSGAFVMLGRLYSELSGLLLLVTDIFMTIENEARNSSVILDEDIEVVF